MQLTFTKILRLLCILFLLVFFNASIVNAQVEKTDTSQLVDDEHKSTGPSTDLPTKNLLVFKDDAATASDGPMSMYIVLLVVLVALIFVLTYIRQRIMGGIRGSAKGAINIVDRKRIGVNTWTTLIQANQAEYLIVENNHGVAIQAISAPPNNAPKSIISERLE